MLRFTLTAILLSWLSTAPALAYGASDPTAAPPLNAADSPVAIGQEARSGATDSVTELPDFAREIGFGLSSSVAGKPYRRLDDEFMPFPVHSYRGERFAALGPNLSYLMFGRERPWSFKTLLAPSLDGFELTESDLLPGMDERRITTEGGFEASYATGLADFSLSTRNDLLSEHDGYRVDAEISRSWWLGRFIMTPEISYSYWDGDRSDYYFGVRPSESAPGRRAYDLDGTGNWGLSLMGFTNLTPQWFMLAGAKYTYYDEDIEDSPLVDKYYSYRLFFGVGYKFGRGGKDDGKSVDFGR